MHSFGKDSSKSRRRNYSFGDTDTYYFSEADILHMEKYVKLDLAWSHVNRKILQVPNFKMKRVKLKFY